MRARHILILIFRRQEPETIQRMIDLITLVTEINDSQRRRLNVTGCSGGCIVDAIHQDGSHMGLGRDHNGLYPNGAVGTCFNIKSIGAAANFADGHPSFNAPTQLGSQGCRQSTDAITPGEQTL